ncbi:hypothetical protein BDZ89DRAFT_1117430 [Hymenopellis radicata]|nr:hypothetical protein BDZ89DRAFT_1117430 [Hymenopellis radicata]
MSPPEPFRMVVKAVTNRVRFLLTCAGIGLIARRQRSATPPNITVAGPDAHGVGEHRVLFEVMGFRRKASSSCVGLTYARNIYEALSIVGVPFCSIEKLTKVACKGACIQIAQQQTRINTLTCRVLYHRVAKDVDCRKLRADLDCSKDRPSRLEGPLPKAITRPPFASWLNGPNPLVHYQSSLSYSKRGGGVEIAPNVDAPRQGYTSEEFRGVLKV